MSTTLHDSLLAEIQVLVDTPAAGDPSAVLERIETTLTDGYAAALQLEGERLRLEKRIGEIATDLRTGDSARKAAEISRLATRLSRADADLTRLRELLRTLRVRHAAARAA